MNSQFVRSASTLVLAVAIAGCGASTDREHAARAPAGAGQAAVDLSPARWPAGEWDRFLAIEMSADYPDNPAGEGFGGAITGSYHALAQRAGLEALKQGGTSVDAAMTTALTQIAAAAGAVISYFGIMTLVHYDAATGEVVSMNAGWNTVRNETDPMSIPGAIGMETVEELYGTGAPSGRTALVGGFMRGVEAAHARYGKLPFDQLFVPAIHIAETGIPFTADLAAYLEPRKSDLSRLAESKAVFTRPDGEFYQVGDPFTQPALAKSLRAIAEHGADYMYTGPWAEKAVAAVRADGGKMTLRDLADYQVMWVEPLKAEHSGYTVYANGLPAYGGVNMIEALHLGKAAGIAQQGHWSQSAESLREASDLTFNMTLAFQPPEVAEQIYPGLDLSAESRITFETAQELWKRMEAGVKLGQYAADEIKPRHSDTVVAVDRWGNMTAVTHSINCVIWGRTAIIVDGISIGDPAVSQKAQIAAAGPGNRLPDPTEVGILARDGQPVVAFASMATGLHQQTFQSLTNVMDFGMTPKEALDAPSFFLPRPVGGDPLAGVPPKWVVRVMEGEFDQALLDATGLPIEQVTAKDRRFMQGLWVGISRDPETGALSAGSHPYSKGQALAY